MRDMKKAARIYYHYEQLEEYHAGMWRIVRGQERQDFIEASASLMKEPDLFRAAMMRAIKEWPRSCEFNFSSFAVNRIAWLGHAGCCIAVRSPEEATRCGWHTLTLQQQDEANRVAAEVLLVWDTKYWASSQLGLFDA